MSDEKCKSAWKLYIRNLFNINDKTGMANYNWVVIPLLLIEFALLYLYPSFPYFNVIFILLEISIATRRMNSVGYDTWTGILICVPLVRLYCLIMLTMVSPHKSTKIRRQASKLITLLVVIWFLCMVLTHIIL